MCCSAKGGRNTRDASVIRLRAGPAKPLQQQEGMRGALSLCLDRMCSNDLQLQQGMEGKPYLKVKVGSGGEAMLEGLGTA